LDINFKDNKGRTMITGTYHKFNYLKFRILEALFDAYPASLTCKEIADNGDIELKKVESSKSLYVKQLLL
jgi:hypothetical protein